MADADADADVLYRWQRLPAVWVSPNRPMRIGARASCYDFLLIFLERAMDQQSTLHYHGWTIIARIGLAGAGAGNGTGTGAVPWSVSCDIVRIGVDGVAVPEGATMPFVREHKDDALAAACDEAKQQIDNFIANPLVRLA